MAIVLELTCACGSTFEYNGDRAGEREAKAVWALEHVGHSVVAEPAPEFVPEFYDLVLPEPVAAVEPKASGRKQREAVA